VSPTVSLLAPADGATVQHGNVPLTASASDADSGVARVQFYVNGALKGTDTTAPYGITWSAKKRGTYTLQAVATDVAGRTASSATRTVTVR